MVKIEKRRAKVIEAKTDFSDTTLLVDRYRYLDLFPVASTELKVRLCPVAAGHVSSHPSTNNVAFISIGCIMERGMNRIFDVVAEG